MRLNCSLRQRELSWDAKMKKCSLESIIQFSKIQKNETTIGIHRHIEECFAIFLVVLGHVLEHAGLKDDFLFYFIYRFFTCRFYLY